MNVSRWIKVVIVVIVLSIGGYLTANIRGGGSNVPSTFSEARMRGALVAQTIVGLSNDLAENLQAVSDLDRSGHYEEALSRASVMLEKSVEVRAEAMKLAAELEIMTQSLSGITSKDARAAAIEAITHRLTIVSRLVDYSNYLNQLLETLRAKFSGDVPSEDVKALIDAVNDEVGAINDFNGKASEAMDRFDKLIR